MRVLISGASGLVGAAVLTALRHAGHTVNRLVRPGGTGAPGDAGWDPLSGRMELAGLEGVDGVVHLAGASIAEGRWTDARKQVLRTSRVEATRHLVNGLTRLARPPKVLISASAIGYYGSRGDEQLTEACAPGDDFLAHLARDWEAEAVRAEQNGIRTVVLRFGVILSAAGGALPRMLLPFKLGAGGRLGSGQQWMSWLSLPEAAGFVRHALENTGLRGAVNAVAPCPVRNSEFTKALGKVLRRPTLFPAPAFALKLALGEMAEALLLSSQRVIPARLQEQGYHFMHPELERALRAVLKR
ncbi:MAG: TIGR01777 family protein [Acidobacteria bacterium]|nr:TIGR01777 family protein [Acidobacteriota bacterium]MBI3662551.1 TIGR01777 family protein [Acidobacteriota bacterium]